MIHIAVAVDKDKVKDKEDIREERKEVQETRKKDKIEVCKYFNGKKSISSILVACVAKYGVNHGQVEVYKYQDRVGLGYRKPKKLIVSSPWKMQISKLELTKVKMLRFWLPEEEKVFKQCVLKYGSGDYESIITRRQILGKSKAQFYTKLQKLYGFQSISPWNGLHINLDTFKCSEEEKEEYNSLDEKGQIMFAKEREEPEEIWKAVEIDYFRRWFEPPQRQVIIEELKEGQNIDSDIEAQFVKENANWQARYRQVRPLCISAASFFTNLTREKLLSYRIERKGEEIELVDDADGGIKELSIIREFYCFKQEGTGNNIMIERVNNNLYQVYSEEHEDIKFDFFKQPQKSRFIQQDILTYKPSQWFNVLILDPPWVFYRDLW